MVMARVLVNMPSQYCGKPSGVSRVAFALLERLIAIGGHDYILRSNWTRRSLPSALSESRLDVLEVPRPNIVIADVVRQFLSVPDICRDRNVDIVWNVDLFGAARGGRARVTTVHDLYFYTVPELVGRRAAVTMGLCARLVLGGSDLVVTISEATRTDLVKCFPSTASRISIIGNDSTLPFNANAVHSHPREIESEYVLIVGNATPNKNFQVVVEALGRLARTGFRPLLVHVGRDDSGVLAAACAGMVSPPSYLSIADVDDVRLAALYENALCLVAPSLSEGFCLPVVEAQAAGCPVIAASASVLPEVAGNGALFFEPLNCESLAARIVELFSTPLLRAKLIDRGVANRARFSWDRSAERYAEIFEKLSDTNG